MCRKKSAGDANQPVSGLGFLIDSRWGPRTPHPSLNPQHVSPEWLQALQHIPPSVKTHSGAEENLTHWLWTNFLFSAVLFVFQGCRSFWLVAYSVLMAWLLLDTFPLIRNNSPRLSVLHFPIDWFKTRFETPLIREKLLLFYTEMIRMENQVTQRNDPTVTCSG